MAGYHELPMYDTPEEQLREILAGEDSVTDRRVNTSTFDP